MPTLVIATTNTHKLGEYAAIFADLPVTLRSLADVGIYDDVEETGATFADNAQLKAAFYGQRSGLPVLADDSGLEVAALGGEPGVRSARYAGPGKTDADRIALVLNKLAGVPPEQRQARFVCVIALTRPGSSMELVEGALDGVIDDAPRGTQGFGYDPLVYIPAEGATVGELSPERKNEISHRARAAQHARVVLERWLAEGWQQNTEEE